MEKTKELIITHEFGLHLRPAGLLVKTAKKYSSDITIEKDGMVVDGKSIIGITTLHAERNAIYNAARIGVSLRESTMYLTCGIPCSDCAKGIISSGIKRIHCKIKDTTRNREYWDEHAKRSLQMFKESGVEVIFYNDNV